MTDTMNAARFNVILEAPALGESTVVEAATAEEAGAIALRDRGDGWTVKSCKLIPEGFSPTPAKQTYSVGLKVPAPGSSRLVLASSAEEAIAIVNRDNPGLAGEARPIGRSSADAMREEKLAVLLERAESFIAGFEGDETQEGVDELLEEIREELA